MTGPGEPSRPPAAGRGELAGVDRTYQLLVETMNVGSATVSPQGVIVGANARLAAMSGHTVASLVGMPVLGLATPASRAGLARLLDLGAGDSRRAELELSGPGGTPVPALLAASAFTIDATMMRCLIFTDLTAQRAAERHAARAQAVLDEHSTFLEQAQAAIGLGWWIGDARAPGGLNASPEVYRTFGVSPGEFDGTARAFWAQVHPLDTDRVRAAVRRACQEGTPFRLEHRVAGPDGQVRWALESAVAEPGADGRPRRLLGICQDITERRRIEDEIRSAAAYNRSLFEASPDPLMMVAPDGLVTDVNAATERATGLSRARLVGQGFAGRFTDPGRAAAGCQRTFREGSVHDYALDLLHRDGHSTPVLYNAAVYRDPSGRVLGVLAAIRDVTEVRRAEGALRESAAQLRALNAELEERVRQRTAELQRANESLRSFTYSVSHDLRAPLRALTGFSEALADDYAARLDEEGLGYLRRIVSASERMGLLIDDLLQLSRVSRAEISPQAVDLSAEAHEVAGELGAREPGRRVRFLIQEGVRARADRVLIRTVLQNLLENAWKFTARRDGATVEFGARTSGGETAYYVRDNGAGFDCAYAGQLFQPFQRLHAADEFPGTGIGLASVRQIVERHGGRVWAEGAEGAGATFSFTLDPARGS